MGRGAGSGAEGQGVDEWERFLLGQTVSQCQPLDSALFERLNELHLRQTGSSQRLVIDHQIITDDEERDRIRLAFLEHLLEGADNIGHGFADAGMIRRVERPHVRGGGDFHDQIQHDQLPLRRLHTSRTNGSRECSPFSTMPARLSAG